MRIKTRVQPWIAFFTLICFAFLMHVATVPVRAMAAASEESAVVGAEQPGVIEQSAPAPRSYQKKSSPLLPIIIGVVVVGAVAAVLILVVFKTKYDILGVWSWDQNTTSHNNDLVITFSGTKASGTLSTELEGENCAGTFTVSGKNVTIHIAPIWGNIDFTGTFSDKNLITGNVSGYCGWCTQSFTGTATLTRVGTAGSVKPIVTSLTHGHLHQPAK